MYFHCLCSLASGWAEWLIGPLDDDAACALYVRAYVAYLKAIHGTP